MSLITNLKFGELTNLSDARFAAGSQANFLGFSLDPDSENYIEHDDLNEILGWIEGVGLVGEFGKQDFEEIRDAIQQYKLDYVQLNETEHFFSLSKLKAQIIQNLDLATFRDREELEYFIEDSYQNITYYMFSIYNDEDLEAFLNDNDFKKRIKDFTDDLNVILNLPFNAENIIDLTKEFKPFAINIYAGGEERPGYKDFDELIEMVESLDE
jgi:phosphoribosylanthranilate isomerase